MHLCCLGHMSTLIDRWLPMLNSKDLSKINSLLLAQRFLQDMTVKVNYPLSYSINWKANFKCWSSFGRALFAKKILSYFSLYTLSMRLSHCPESSDEIELADKIIHLYYQNTPMIYDETIEIYSLHAHLHLRIHVTLEN